MMNNDDVFKKLLLSVEMDDIVKSVGVTNKDGDLKKFEVKLMENSSLTY